MGYYGKNVAIYNSYSILSQRLDLPRQQQQNQLAWNLGVIIGATISSKKSWKPKNQLFVSNLAQDFN